MLVNTEKTKKELEEFINDKIIQKQPIFVYFRYIPSNRTLNIKKENIGLIEVMGLAVLPARLKKEMAELEQAILNHEDLRQNETVAAHAEWAEGWIPKYKITDSNIHSIIQKEIGIVFAKVLEDAGVYKRTSEGKAAFKRFIESL